MERKLDCPVAVVFSNDVKIETDSPEKFYTMLVTCFKRDYLYNILSDIQDTIAYRYDMTDSEVIHAIKERIEKEKKNMHDLDESIDNLIRSFKYEE